MELIKFLFRSVFIPILPNIIFTISIALASLFASIVLLILSIDEEKRCKLENISKKIAELKAKKSGNSDND